MNPPQDRYIQVGQVCARYWAEGSDASPVVLIHALGGYVENWLPSWDVLTARHRVYAVDLLGHGRTDKPLDVSYDIAHLAQFVKGFMAALGIEHAHVVGHSLGGAIGTRLALMYPAVVDKLVLEASGGLGRAVTALLRITSLPILGEIITRPSRSGSAYMLRQIVYDPAVVTSELIELDYQLSILPHTQQCFLKTVRANCSLLGQSKSAYGTNVAGLASLTKPVLIVWGRQDGVIPLAQAEAAAKSLPDARLQVLDNCGHYAMLEHPRAFNEAVLEFLAD